MHSLKQIFQDNWIYFNYSITKSVNGFLYYLRKIPLLNKMISHNIFAAYHVKEALSIFFTIIIVLFSFMKKFGILIFFICLNLIPLLIATDFDLQLFVQSISPEILQQGIIWWFLFTVILYDCYTEFSATLSQKTISFITEFNFPATRFIMGQKVMNPLKQTVFYFPAALLYGLLAGNIVYSFFIPIAYLTCNLGFIVLNRWVFMQQLNKWHRRLLASLYLCIWSIIIFSVYSFHLVSAIETILTSWPMEILYLGLAGLFFKMIWNYEDYSIYSQKLIQFSTTIHQKVAQANNKNQQYMSSGLKMQKKLTFTQDNHADHLKGNDYLNALLFHRYKQAFRQKLIYTGLGLGIVALLVIGFDLFNIPLFSEEKEVVNLLPTLFLIMYFLSFGKQIVQMVFLNCDSAMLYYPFYREGKTILRGFTYRLRKTFFYNSFIIIGILAIFLLLHVTHDFLFSWQFFGVLLLLLVSLAFLFSFHELFIYYLLQPFTSDLSVKNPLYKIISVGFYYFSYLNMSVNVSGFSYTIIISIICLLYVIIGLIIIYRIAPKTFKIKT